MASQQIILKCFKTINFRWRRERIFNKTLALAVESEIYNYAKSNLAIINIFIKEPYSKRFRKTEKMSRIAYIASSGGLLGRVATKILQRFNAFLGHNRFLSSDARFIALPLYNRFFNYPFPFIIDSLNLRSIFVATLLCCRNMSSV